jgi:hypothetical protein
MIVKLAVIIEVSTCHLLPTLWFAWRPKWIVD